MRLKYPKSLTPELKEVLGLMIPETGPLAHAFRDAGEAPDLPRRIEDEHAYILDKLITLALKHGSRWREEFSKILKPVLDKAEANLKAKEAAGARDQDRPPVAPATTKTEV